MHEYSIVMSLLEAVQAEMEKHRATVVRRVVIRIGELSGVDPELLASAFTTIREDTVCRDSELELKYVAADWRCGVCGTAIQRGEILHCPSCRIPATMQAGNEIILERVEMEVPDV